MDDDDRDLTLMVGQDDVLRGLDHVPSVEPIRRVEEIDLPPLPLAVEEEHQAGGWGVVVDRGKSRRRAK